MKKNIRLLTITLTGILLLPALSPAAQDAPEKRAAEPGTNPKAAAEKTGKEQSEDKLRPEAGAGVNNFNFPEAEGAVELRPPHGTRITLKLTDTSRAIYEAIGKQAKIAILFDPDYTPRPVSVDLNSIPLLDALKVVAFQSRTFWRAVTGDAIFVTADTQAKRHEFEQQIVKTFYFPNITSPADLQDVVNEMRTILEVPRIQQMPGYQSITLRATPQQMVIAEKLIGDLNRAREKTGGQYRLEFKINESDAAKRGNGRVFTLLIEPHQVGKLRLGPKIPIQTTDKDKTYVEAGKNIDCQIRYETERTVSLRLTVEFSDAESEEGTASSGANPILQQLRMDTSVTLELGTPTVVSSFQDPISKHNFQIEATAVRTKSKE